MGPSRTKSIRRLRVVRIESKTGHTPGLPLATRYLSDRRDRLRLVIVILVNLTFIVNQDGVVYQKDLGPNTSDLASAMADFNPDNTWNRAD
ncbi:MAG: DUF2950 family protein [Silvibacterium sp.]|nr:DUF2950 family protein [Silvibacterium sp.]